MEKGETQGNIANRDAQVENRNLHLSNLKVCVLFPLMPLLFFPKVCYTEKIIHSFLKKICLTFSFKLKSNSALGTTLNFVEQVIGPSLLYHH